MHATYDQEQPRWTDVSFQASVSLWYCAPFLAAGLVGLGSLAAGAAIGALIAAAIGKKIFKYHKDDKDDGEYIIYESHDHGGYDHGGYDHGGYDHGGYDDGGYHRRSGGGKHKNDYVELTKRSFGDSHKPPLLKTFFRTKRSMDFHRPAKIKNIPKDFKLVKELYPAKINQEERILQAIHDGDELRCGERLVCEVAGVSNRPLSYAEQQILRFVWAGDDQFDRLMPGEAVSAHSAALALYQRAASLGAKLGACAAAYRSCPLSASAMMSVIASLQRPYGAG